MSRQTLLTDWCGSVFLGNQVEVPMWLWTANGEGGEQTEEGGRMEEAAEEAGF